MEAYARYSVDIFQPPVSHDSSHRGSASSIDLSNEENDDMEVKVYVMVIDKLIVKSMKYQCFFFIFLFISLFLYFF